MELIDVTKLQLYSVCIYIYIYIYTRRWHTIRIIKLLGFDRVKQYKFWVSTRNDDVDLRLEILLFH